MVIIVLFIGVMIINYVEIVGVINNVGVQDFDFIFGNGVNVLNEDDYDGVVISLQ